MYSLFSGFKRLSVDWILFFSILPLLAAGLITMHTFTGDNYFFNRQLLWVFVSLSVFFIFSFIDWRFLRQSYVVAGLYIIGLLPLIFLVVMGQVTGQVTRGIEGWITFGGFSVQPSEFFKLILIIILAKYFTRRHIEIANIRHIIISGLYAFVPFVLIFLQPDLGSAIIIFLIWFGMILMAGISKKHLLAVFTVGILSFLLLWNFVFYDYQKARIISFLDPLADIQGTGYNAFQSMVAVGSGQLFGKGVGYGTQSKLQFLPEHQTDFIFASFAEEWGFIGVFILVVLLGVVIWRIMANALTGATNFEVLFGVGLAIMFMSHFVIHIGMNIGWLPVTGLPLPFLSYGGSHLLTEFMGLGILMGMRKYSLAFHRDDVNSEFLGPR